MKIKPQSKIEISLLLSVFIFIALLGTGTKYLEYHFVKTMHTTTTDIFDHPLKVSSAALTLKVDVYKMHGDMKDIVLSSSKSQIIELSKDIAEHEKSAYKNLAVIEKNILGEEGLALQKNTKQLFESWKPIRDELIRLMNSGKTQEAIDITQAKGAKHVLKLESSVLELYNYAQNKAVGFKDKSISNFEKIELIIIGTGILFLLIIIAIGYYIIGRISHFMDKNEHLKNVLSVIRDVNQLIVREKDPQKMIQESCNILISTGVYGQAWIVTCNDDGETEYFAITDMENIDIMKDKIMSEWSPYCIQKTKDRTKHYSFVEDTLSECLSCPLTGLYGDKSAFNIQLNYNNKVYGYLTLSIEKMFIENHDDFLLLNEVAGDIAYALYNIRIQEQLIAQEERYRFVIEGTQDGLWDWNVVNNTLYYSPKWKGMLGYSDNELDNSYETWEKLVNPDDKEQALLDIQTSQNSKTGLYNNIHRLKHKNGSWVWIQARGKTIFNENGEAVRMIGSHTDITEQKELEEDLLESQKRYETAEKIGKVGTWDYNISTQDFWGSVESKRIYGLPAESDIFSIDMIEGCIVERERVHQALEDLIEKGTEYNLEFEIHPYDGSAPKIILSIATLEYDENNKPKKISGFIQDITERKAIEQALSLETKRYVTAEKLGKVGSWEQDFVQEILTWSYEVYEIFEIDHAVEMTFEHFMERIHPQDKGLVSDTFAKSVKEHTPYDLPHRLLFSDGRVKYVRERAEHYYDENNNHVRTVGTVQDITVEELSKKELAILNDKFEKAFNTTPNIIVITNQKTGKIYEVNQTFEHIMGYKREDVIGKTTLDINLWNNSDEREAYIKTFREKGIVENAVFAFKKKNGDLIIAKIYASLITIDNEDYILAVSDDITKRLEAENQMENLFSMSNVGLAVTSLEKGWIRVNEKLLEAFGYTEDEFKQTTWPEITYPEDLEKDLKLFNEIIDGKRDGYKIEKRFIKKDGSIFEAIITVSAYKPNEKIEYFLASILDVSELKQAQREFKTIIQEAPNPIMIHNEDGKVLMLNKVWEKLTGYTHDEINTIEKWTEKAYGKEMPTVKKYIDKLYGLAHAVNEGEYPIITNSGETIIWQFSSAPLGVMDGKRTVISSAMDITELKKKDEMMINQSRQAAMGDMIAMIAHQWRQPITVIGMVANNIKMNIELEEQIQTQELEKMANTISKQTQQLSQTIDDFRNFFQPNQEKAQTTIASVLEATLKIIGKSLENNNIAITIEDHSEVKLLTYPNHMLQVFLNLLGNAKDILLDKKISDAKVTITVDETKNSIVTTICDNGGGIPKDAIKRLGEPYFTTKEKNGTGLGLYMSITIVNKHLNGTLTWKNRDKGACFIVTLPKE